MRAWHLVATISFLTAGGLALSAGCGGSSGDSVFAPANGGDDGGTGGDGATLVGLGDGSTGSCTGLECAKKDCGSGPKTSVSGTVFDPAGKVPLYNVIVYVPNAPVDPISHGASCDKCGATVSGSPIATALTDAAGHFVLSDIPVMDNLPLVIQVGKWRRQVKLSQSITACADNPITDASLTRLPRNQSEGDLPQIALTTGGCDALECLLRKIGISDSEFTPPTGKGRVHVYQGESSPDPGNNNQRIMGGTLASPTPPATDLWDTKASLMGYDLTLLACECDPDPTEKPQAALQAMFDYANAGGRIFASHYHYYWLESGIQPFPTTASWDHANITASSITATVDDGFPKGAAFKQWLVNVGGSPAPGGSVDIGQPRFDVDVVNTHTSQRWLYDTSHSDMVQYMTFNTPIGTAPDNQCGRVVYSDLHVTGYKWPNGQLDKPGQTFPTGCVTTDLSPQEKALEFMLFDLSACVQSDTQPPVPPPR